MVILDFFKNALNLKNISRQGWIDKLSMEHPESVADHSYSMAIMGMVISDLENYDSEKMLKMILLHDLAESKIGDFTPDQISKDKKEKIENNAYDEIINTLPNTIKLQYGKIWEEYQKQVENSEIDGMINNYEIWVDDLLNESNDGFVKEIGEVESWSKVNRDKILKQKEEAIEYLKKLKK